VQKILEDIGLESRRIQLINMSSAMGGQFAWSAAEMTAEIKLIGPNPIGKDGNIEETSSEELS
jgi:F420-non-reducing hydrogenase iron-sulfur subunit